MSRSIASKLEVFKLEDPSDKLLESKLNQLESKGYTILHVVAHTSFFLHIPVVRIIARKKK